MLTTEAPTRNLRSQQLTLRDSRRGSRARCHRRVGVLDPTAVETCLVGSWSCNVLWGTSVLRVLAEFSRFAPRDWLDSLYRASFKVSSGLKLERTAYQRYTFSTDIGFCRSPQYDNFTGQELRTITCSPPPPSLTWQTMGSNVYLFAYGRHYQGVRATKLGTGLKL